MKDPRVELVKRVREAIAAEALGYKCPCPECRRPSCGRLAEQIVSAFGAGSASSR